MSPKKSKSKQLPADPNQRAFSIAEQATDEDPTPDPTESLSKAQISELMKAMGRKGGLKGGHARAQKLTPKKRTQIAKAAAKKRWAKHKKGKSKPPFAK